MGKHILLLLLCVMLLSACGTTQLFETSRTPSPTGTSIPEVTRTPTPASTPVISYLELAQQLGYQQIQVHEAVEGGTFSLWMPASYRESPYSWLGGEFLNLVSQSIDDYAYDIYAKNILFTASDTAFFENSHYANECSELKNMVTNSRVEIAVRTGQDLQLQNMTLANYAGLLAIAIQNMRGDQWKYPQASEPFQGTKYEAWRIISDFAPRRMDISLSGFSGQSFDIVYIDYILKEGDRIWVLTFSTDPELFWEEGACTYLADNFDLIVRTFETFPNEK